MLSTKGSDNYCYVKNNTPVLIRSFTPSVEGTIIGRRLKNLRSFFKEPINSTTLGICLVDKEPTEAEKTFSFLDLALSRRFIDTADVALL